MKDIVNFINEAKQAAPSINFEDFKEVNLSAEERQKSLDKMTILALESI